MAETDLSTEPTEIKQPSPTESSIESTGEKPKTPMETLTDIMKMCSLPGLYPTPDKTGKNIDPTQNIVAKLLTQPAPKTREQIKAQIKELQKPVEGESPAVIVAKGVRASWLGIVKYF